MIISDNEPNQLEDWQQNVGHGWAALVEMAWAQCQARGATIATVKEKWGRLRIYVYSRDEYIYGALDAIEELSGYTCEYCGQPGHVREIDGWYKSLCDECAALAQNDMVQ